MTAKVIGGVVYEATLQVLGKKFYASGESVSEAIEALEPEGTARARSILTVDKIIYKGKKEVARKSKDRILTFPMANRMFNLSPKMREVSLKQVSLLFSAL